MIWQWNLCFMFSQPLTFDYKWAVMGAVRGSRGNTEVCRALCLSLRYPIVMWRMDRCIYVINRILVVLRDRGKICFSILYTFGPFRLYHDPARVPTPICDTAWFTQIFYFDQIAPMCQFGRITILGLSTFEASGPPGPCGSLRLLKLAWTNQFSYYIRKSGHEPSQNH